MTNQQRIYTNEEERRSRALTDEDIDFLSDELEKKLTARFYNNLGKGVWAMAWKALVWLVIVIAAYGASQELKR